MTSPRFAEVVYNQYRDCCLTDSYEDEGCKIDVSGFNPGSLTTIHGTKHQDCSKHQRPGRLCDRLIFGRVDNLNRDFVCAAELKGGRNLDASVAIEQIQNGLTLAHGMLGNRSTVDWYPLLFYGGRLRGHGLDLLRSRKVSFGGKKRLVDRVDCGASLLRCLTVSRR